MITPGEQEGVNIFLVFAGWLDVNEPIGREEGHALLCKTGPAFVYYHPVRDGVRVDAAFEALAADIAERLSAKVFAAAPVEVHMCDQKLATLKIVTDR